jgi:hypothetical protein
MVPIEKAITLNESFSVNKVFYPETLCYQQFHFSVGSDSFSVENMQQMAQQSVRCSAWNKLCPMTKSLRTWLDEEVRGVSSASWTK